MIGLACDTGYTGNAIPTACSNTGFLVATFGSQSKLDYTVKGCFENQCAPLDALPRGVKAVAPLPLESLKGKLPENSVTCTEGLRLSAVGKPFCNITCDKYYYPHYAAAKGKSLTNAITCPLEGGIATSLLRCASMYYFGRFTLWINYGEISMA